MLVFQVPASNTSTEYEAAMWNTTMVLSKLFLTDKMYSSVIIGEVVRQFLDFLLNCCLICTFFSYNKALTGVLLAGSELRIGAASYSSQCLIYRNGVLLAILYTLDAADCIRVTLADSFAPKSIIIAVRQYCVCIKTIQENMPGSQPQEIRAIWPLSFAALSTLAKCSGIFA